MPLPGIPPLVLLIALALKEASDIGTTAVVTYQSGKKFKAYKGGAGGSVGIDGDRVTVTVGDARFVLPLDEAAQQGNGGGVGGRAKKPPAKSRIEEILDSPLGVVTGAGVARRISAGVMVLSRPRPGEDAEVAVPAPDPAAKPFTFREYFTAQQAAATKGGARKDLRERELAALQQTHEFKLGLLDAQIEREKIAAQVDVARLQAVTRLEEQRRDLMAKFGLQRELLVSRLQEQAEQAGFELEAQREKFGLQGALDVAEREWKTVESKADRVWRERVQKDQSEIAQYRLNLNSDLAVGRAVDAAVKLGEALKRHGLAPAGLVSFAQAFAGR